MEKVVEIRSDNIFNFGFQRKIAKYFAIFNVCFLEEIVYPFNLFTDSIVIFLNVWIYLLLYSTGYKLTGSTEINGLTIPMVVWILTFAKAMQESRISAPQISDSIIDGTFIYKVSRPYSYILFSFFTSLGKTAPYLIVNLFTGSIFCYLIVGPIHISALSSITALIIFMLGFAVDFYIQMMIGLASLWIEKTDGLWWLYSKLKLTLGGIIIPIALLPGFLQKIAEYLPFSQIFYAPSHLLFQFDSNLFCHYLLIGSIWVIILGYLSITVFNRGMKHVTSNGG